MSSLAAQLAVCIFVLGMAKALVGDLAAMTIRNRLIGTLLVAFIILAPITGITGTDFAMSATAATMVLVGGFVLFTCGWVGGGDVKLAAVSALWLGAEHTPAYLVCAAAIGGVLTLGVLGFRLIPLPAAMAGRRWASRLHDRHTGIPYGVALALSAIAMLPRTQWLTLI